jgi:hypothetical protein
MAHFLINDALWRTLTARIRTAHHVDAAVAYFGQDGARLFPLRKGHRLVVDMSIATVRAGGTDPREVEKLLRHDVLVFTRSNLHAKVVVADNAVIAGSANVSKNSRRLDEAGILTSDQVAVLRAREFIERLCTEPVRPEYLEECKRLYRPPRIPKRRGQRGKPRVTHAKLWLVSLTQYFIPESEVERYEQGEKEAQKKVRKRERSKTSSFTWPHKPRMADELARISHQWSEKARGRTDGGGVRVELRPGA